MLATPVGAIKITRNQQEIDYSAVEHTIDMPIVKSAPLAGCYRITIVYNQNDTISCELVVSEELKRGNSGGENYACKVFTKDNIELTIGAIDMVGDECVCDYLDNGLIFENLCPSQNNQITFGVSWVDDLQEGDNRTWFTADPTHS